VSDTQKSNSLVKLKVGDLVKFPHTPVQGIVLKLETLAESPHPSQPQREVALIEWANPYTPRGRYQVHLLEIVHEVS